MAIEEEGDAEREEDHYMLVREVESSSIRTYVQYEKATYRETRRPRDHEPTAKPLLPTSTYHVIIPLCCAPVDGGYQQSQHGRVRAELRARAS
jgi:hypothetical protein